MFNSFANDILGISSPIVVDVVSAVIGVLFVSLIISFCLGFISALSHKLFK